MRSVRVVARLVATVATVAVLGTAPGAAALERRGPTAGVDYTFSCTVTGLPGLTYSVVINVAGTAPATVHSGGSFTATGIRSTTTYPLTVTVLRGALPVHAVNGVALTHSELVTQGPVTIMGGVPFTSGPISASYRATGAPGKHVELRPGTVTADLVTYGHATCLLAPGQRAFAVVSIV